MTDPLLDLGPSLGFPMVSMPQWVDQKNLAGKPFFDARPDWFGESVKQILMSATAEREREIFSLVTQDGKSSYPLKADLRVGDKRDNIAGEYIWDQGVIKIEILAESVRLNTRRTNTPVSGGMNAAVHNAEHGLRGTLRHEARHAWQDFMRHKRCKACADNDDGVANKPPNDSDSDFLPERVFKPIDGDDEYKDSRCPAIGWINDVASCDPSEPEPEGVLSDDNAQSPFPDGPLGPPKLDAIDQLEINAFFFWACLESPPHANCPKQ